MAEMGVIRPITATGGRVAANTTASAENTFVRPQQGTPDLSAPAKGQIYTLAQRRWFTVFLMPGALMNMIDTTIANVALPEMQGTTGASREEITWVLTSYIVGMAIALPLVGWSTARFSRKRVLVYSIAAFTMFSLLCGISSNVEQLVIFRFCQGFSGASIIPLAQAELLDVYPREEHGKALSILSTASVAGPLVGPLLGGWLTSNFSWGWVFLVNVPLGIASVIGLSLIMREERGKARRPFDFVSYGLLAVAIGTFQLMADRGAILDWFDSTEIRIEAAVVASAFLGFLWISAEREKPLYPQELFANRNYVIGTGLVMVGLSLVMSVQALMPAMLASSYGYPVQEIGLLMAPRGLGTLLVTFLVPALVRRFGALPLTLVGIILLAISNAMLSWLTLQADGTLILVSGLIQGMGNSLMWSALTLVSFNGLAPHLRDDAAALHTLARHAGSAAAISLLQVMTSHLAAASHANLAAATNMDQLPDTLRAIGEAQRLSALNAEVTQQAGMVAYANTFWIMALAHLLMCPALLLLRSGRQRQT